MAKSAALVRSEGEVERLRLELDRTRTELRSAQDAIRNLADELAKAKSVAPKTSHADLMSAKRAQAADLVAKYGHTNVRQVGGKFEVRIADAWGNPAV